LTTNGGGGGGIFSWMVGGSTGVAEAAGYTMGAASEGSDCGVSFNARGASNDITGDSIPDKDDGVERRDGGAAEIVGAIPEFEIGALGGVVSRYLLAARRAVAKS
jgi:hypothetical protein